MTKMTKFSLVQIESVSADDNASVTKMTQFFIDMVENIVGKAENACYHHFLLFSRCFPKASFHVLHKVCNVC